MRSDRVVHLGFPIAGPGIMEMSWLRSRYAKEMEFVHPFYMALSKLTSDSGADLPDTISISINAMARLYIALIS